MIAVDTLRVFEDEEIKTGILTRSFAIFTAEILDGFVEMGIADKFYLVVSDDAVSFFEKRFPDYKRIVLKSWFVSFLRMLHCGKQRHVGEFSKIGVYKKMVDKAEVSAIWFPVGLPREVVLCDTPMIVTVHDLILYHSSADKKEKDGYSSFIGKSAMLVAISNHVKQDICESFCISPAKIEVIPNAVTVDTTKEKKPNDIPKSYILDINAYTERKNPMTLLKAFHQIKDKIQEDLVFCGGYGDCREALMKYVEEHQLTKRVRLYFKVDETEKNYLLNHASLFVMPSTNEGFGRTPVEAAICGVPVISTKATSLYEATKGLVNYYEEPENVDELAEKILECLQKSDVSNLKKISEELADCYSPKNCAKMYWDVFNQFSSV